MVNTSLKRKQPTQPPFILRWVKMASRYFDTRRLAFGLNLVFYFIIAAVLLSSCHFNPPLQGQGSSFLQGEWNQDSVKKEKQLLNYTLTNIRFTCDSFYMRLASYSKVNYGADSCLNKGHWTEYVKGNYEQKQDTIHLKGFFCKPDYSFKMEGGCFRVGVYEDQFIITSKKDSVLTFSTASSPFRT
jgi:hypothetical protein